MTEEITHGGPRRGAGRPSTYAVAATPRTLHFPEAFWRRLRRAAPAAKTLSLALAKVLSAPVRVRRKLLETLDEKE